MYTPDDYLKQTFDSAFTSWREITEGNPDALHNLNREVTERNLGGRAVVLSLEDSDLHPAHKNVFDSHFLPQGRLKCFDVLVQKDEDPELVVILDDIRGSDIGGFRVTLWGQEVPIDVATELRCDSLFERIRGYLTADNLSFDEVLKIIRRIPPSNLNLATFVAGMNDFALPGNVLSSAYAKAGGGNFISESESVGSSQLPTFYSIGRRDMYRLATVDQTKDIFLLICNMTPAYWNDSYRTVLIDEGLLGYDLA